jgi:release factor glutamine methyltransferase
MTPPEISVATWRQLWRETSDKVADPVETRWLLEEASGLDASDLLRDLDQSPDLASIARLGRLLERRLSGEPLQHVLGHWGFRTLDVVVDSRALVPRPETELVVEFALFELDRLAFAHSDGELWAADLGTGSGVIALSLVAERDTVRVVATDCDQAALELAATNLSALSSDVAERVQLVEGDWYRALPAGLRGRLGLVVSNPPYLAEREWAGLDANVRDFDPFGALVAGPSGLEAIEAVVTGAPAVLCSDGSLVVEIAPDQAKEALELASDAGYRTARVEDDLVGRPRVLVARR